MRNGLKKIIFLILMSIAYLISAAWTSVFAADFPDMPRTHKNYTAVSDLVELGVIAGYDDGFFRPEREITRTEFCALMARTLGINKEEYTVMDLPFSDVSEGYWGEAYISFCFELGIINGMGDGTFWPAEKVTLEQATKMAVCAIGKGDEALSYIGEKWYSGYVKLAEKNNLFYKVEQNFATPAVRGDIAQLVYNMIDTGLVPDNSQEGSGEDKSEEPAEPEPGEAEEEEETSTIPPEILEAYRKKDFSEVRTILVDAGHNYSGRDTGAENKLLGLKEEEITWQIADKLRNKLEDMGYTVVMTRDKLTDSIANTSVLESLQSRVDLGHESLSDLFISIHCNAGGGSGTEAYSFSKKSYAGHLAQMIQKNITSNTNLYDRGTKTANFFVIQNTLMPAVLIETGFIDSDRDTKVIASVDGQEAIAQAIADAVYEYDRSDLAEMILLEEEDLKGENEDE